MSYKAPIGEKDFLQRRAPPRTKFVGVQSVVETGLTTDVAQYMRENEIKVKRQPGELFSRVRTSKVAKSIELKFPKAVELLPDGGYANPMDEYRDPSAKENPELDILLVDCRSLEDYSSCHVKGALHYPKIKLNHSTNPFLAEMYAYKDKEGKLIVMYDLDESLVVEMANNVYQKGINNVAIMAGGLKEFVQDYSEHITGESPVPIIPRDKKMQRRADEVTQARSEARSHISQKPKSLSNSLAKPRVPRRV